MYWCSLVECFFFVKQKTAYEMRISAWSSDVCSSDLCPPAKHRAPFVCGCTPEVSGPSHETGRVRLLTQRTALTTACADAAHRWFSFLFSRRQIGRASCRESVCQYV